MLENRVILEQFYGAAGTSSSNPSSTQICDPSSTPPSWAATSSDEGGKSTNDAQQKKLRDGPRYFITLAPISSSEDDDSDESCSDSVYDSIHNRETGTNVCNFLIKSCYSCVITIREL